MGLPAAVPAAVGAAAAFYTAAGAGTGAPGLAFSLFFASLIVGAAFYALSCTVDLRLVRTLSDAALAFAFGVILGSASALAMPGSPSYGQTAERVARLSGTVSEDPRRTASGRYLLSLQADTAWASDGTRTDARGSIFLFLPEDALARYGSVIRGSGLTLAGKPDAKDPSLFRAAGIVEHRPASAAASFRAALRRSVVERFSRLRGGALLSALILGYRDDMEAESADAYRAAGCSHILALSGMHLGVLSAMLALVLRKPLGIRAAAVLGTTIVLLYVLFIGPQPSLVRAALMYVIGAGALLGGTPRPVAGILSAAFMIQLAFSPAAAVSLSFILSYLALAGIVFVGSAAAELTAPYVPPALSQVAGASVGAFLATAAVSAAVFGVLRPVGLIAGIPAAFFASVLMVGGLVWLFLDAVLPAAALLPAFLLEGLNDLNGALISYAARFPGIAAKGSGGVAALSLAVSALLVYGRYRGKPARNRFEPFD